MAVFKLSVIRTDASESREIPSRGAPFEFTRERRPLETTSSTEKVIDMSTFTESPEGGFDSNPTTLFSSRFNVECLNKIAGRPRLLACLAGAVPQEAEFPAFERAKVLACEVVKSKSRVTKTSEAGVPAMAA